MKVGELTERNIGAGSLRGLAFGRPRLVAVAYKGTKLGCGRGSRVRGSPDVVVERKLVAEVKCVKELLAAHCARHLECVRLGGLEVGLPVNFHGPALEKGPRGKVL